MQELGAPWSFSYLCPYSARTRVQFLCLDVLTVHTYGLPFICSGTAGPQTYLVLTMGMAYYIYH